MRNWCLVFLVLGCAEMPASDNPLAAVVVDEPAAEEPRVPVAPPEPAEPEEPADAVVDEVVKVAKSIAKGEDPMKAKSKAKAKGKSKSKAKAKGKSKRKAKSHQRAQARASLGSIQLVTSIPEAVPPRAILALPDGKEIVVKPGQMVPDVGLLVLSIDKDQVEISRVEAAGSRATVHNEVLVVP